MSLETTCIELHEEIQRYLRPVKDSDARLYLGYLSYNKSPICVNSATSGTTFIVPFAFTLPQLLP